jgi:hypothetical protein
MTDATAKAPQTRPATTEDKEGDEEEYTTTNPMAMDREPTFTREDSAQGVQAQPQVTPVASDLTHLSDRVLTDDEQAQYEKVQQSRAKKS